VEFVTSCVREYGLASKETLEIGSREVNGTVRHLFDRSYVGIDWNDGDGVDVVASGHELPINDATFEVVVSTSALEHDPEFWRTLAEVRRVLRPGGYFILTTVSWGFFEHDKPDYYRFLPDVHATLMELAGCDVVVDREDPQSGGPQMLGRRHGA